MAISFLSFALTCFLFLLLITGSTNSQPVLNPVEQESVYKLLDSVNSLIPWRTLFPDDLCSSAPHGVVCGYTTLPSETDPETDPGTVNILELNFGYVSDHNPNPPCDPNSPGPDPKIFSSFPYLRKLFFYKCFTTRPISLKTFSRVGSGLEELVFIENPSLYGSLSESLSESLTNMTNLKRLVITGTNVSGQIPSGFGLLKNLEEVTLSRNKLAGKLPENISNIKKLKILDLGYNGFEGNIPAGVGELESLIKLDLSYNIFSGEFPASMKGLRGLELLDLSYNKFSNSGIGIGIPLFFGEMSSLKVMDLSGNELGGVIPDIWGKLRGLTGIGLSGVGLVGNIPSSLGVFLSNLSYLGLDNNKLSGGIPLEFERLKMLNELNLKNNNLSGRIPFSDRFVARVGGKLEVQGNSELCLDRRVFVSFNKVNRNLGHLKVCKLVETEDSKVVLNHISSSSSSNGYQVPSLVGVFIWLFIM